STYLFYEYGNLSEHSGVSSLSFWTNAMGVEMLRAERLNKVGAVVVEDGPVRTVQYMKWVENFGSVVAEDNFDNSGLTRVLVTLGDRSKERYFDPNTQQWDCYYRDNGTILTIDQECTNESSNDIKYLGKEILSEPYFTQLETAVRKYETDSDELDRRIEIYFN
ncbi:hypothetical protein, partial [Vibrio harveyi]|uniref:hypothetical protein n=2 Tax=Vibrionaceae TaxID=641 RepID=UPI001C0C1116